MNGLPLHVAAELAAAAPDEFVAVRRALEQRLRAEGDAETAGAVAAVRKPPLAIWAVNRVAAGHAADVATAAATADELAEAQIALRRGDRDAATALRDLRRSLRRQQSALTKAAAVVLEAAGRPASDTVLRRVDAIIGAALTGPDREPLLHAALLAEPQVDDGVFAAGDVPGDAAIAAAERERERAAIRRRADELIAKADELHALAAARLDEVATLRRELATAERRAAEAKERATAALSEAADARKRAEE